ncbi:MAG: hypothetical protein ACM3JI_03570 [Anaerolineae bacterium]
MVRVSLIFFCVILFLHAVGFLIRSEWLLDRWLWSDDVGLSYIFIVSVFSAFSFGYFMMAIHGKWRPLPNLAISGLVSFGGWGNLSLLQAA